MDPFYTLTIGRGTPWVFDTLDEARKAATEWPEEGQATIDLEVRDRSLHGVALRNLRLPSDVIILSVKRKGQSIISHGYTRLRRKDTVTVVGSPESLTKMQWMFGGVKAGQTAKADT